MQRPPHLPGRGGTGQPPAGVPLVLTRVRHHQPEMQQLPLRTSVPRELSQIHNHSPAGKWSPRAGRAILADTHPGK